MILAVTHLEVCNRTPVFLQCIHHKKWIVVLTKSSYISSMISPTLYSLHH